MVRLMKKVIMAGLGVEAKARETWEDLVRRGEANEEGYAKRVRERMGFLEKDLKELEKKEREFVDKVMAKLPIATKADLDRLERKIQELTDRLKKA